MQFCKQLLGVNIYSSAGIPLATVLGLISGSVFIGFVTFLAGWALLWIFSKIMQVFGYGDMDTNISGIGTYDPDNDTRRRKN